MNGRLHSYLVEWTIHFFKNRDMIHKRIENIEKDKNGFDIRIKFKDKEQFVIVLETLDIELILSKLNDDSHFSIVTLNSKQNLDLMVKNWKKLAAFKSLNLIFVNPFSNLDKKWIVSPYVHNRICDGNSLELGLKSMFETVDPIEQEQMIVRITN